ncbi:hypothetical protein BD410DRAFT_846960, partial [Rickenella mellea]
MNLPPNVLPEPGSEYVPLEHSPTPTPTTSRVSAARTPSQEAPISPELLSRARVPSDERSVSHPRASPSRAPRVPPRASPSLPPPPPRPSSRAPQVPPPRVSPSLPPPAPQPTSRALQVPPPRVPSSAPPPPSPAREVIETDEGDENDAWLLSDERLGKLGFVVLMPLSLPICLDCGCAVELGSLIKHAGKYHNHKLRNEKEKTKFLEVVELLGLIDHIAIRRPPGIIKALPGLKTVEGYGCRHCNKFTGAERTIREHYVKKHGRKWSSRSKPPEPRSLVQRFYEYDGHQGEDTYFPVVLSLPPPATNSPFERYLAQQKKLDEEKKKSQGPITARDLSVFFHRSQWYIPFQFEGCDMQQMYRFGALPDDDEEWLYPLEVATSQYLEGVVEEVLPELCVHVKRWLRTSKGDIRNDPFRRVQEQKTLEDDARLLCRLLCTVIRSIQSPIEGFNIPLNEVHLAAAENLMKVLKDGRNPFEYIHPLAISLFTSTLKTSGGQFNCPVTRFSMLACINQDGDWFNPRAMSPILTKIQWGLRAVFAVEILKRSEGSSNQDVQFEAYQSLMRFVLEEFPSPFTDLRQTIHLVAGIVHNNDGVIARVSWAPNGEYITYNGEPMTLDQFGQGIRDIVDNMKDIYQNYVLGGLDFSEFFEELDKYLDITDLEHVIVEDVRKFAAGYSWLTEPKNAKFVKKWENRLLEAFMDPKNRQEGIDFYTTDRDGKIHWKLGAIRQWFSDVGDGMDHLISSIHLTVGGVSRGTELACLKVCDTRWGNRGQSIRNGLLCLRPSYSKTRNTFGDHGGVTKYAAYAVTVQFMLHMMIVRPLEKYWARELFLPEQAECYDTHIFVRNGEVMTSDKASESLRRLSLRFIRFPLGIRNYRQIVKTILLKSLIDLDKDDPDLDEVAQGVSHQMGHDQETSDRHYGVDVNTPVMIKSTVDEHMEYISRTFHEVIGMEAKCGLKPGEKVYGFLTGKNRVAMTTAEWLVDKTTSKITPTIKAGIQEGYNEAAIPLQQTIVNMGQEMASSMMAAMMQRPYGPPPPPSLNVPPYYTT